MAKKNTPQRKDMRDWTHPKFGGDEAGPSSQMMLEAELYALTIGEPSPTDKLHYAAWDMAWKKTLHEYQTRFPKGHWLQNFRTWALTPKKK